MLGDEARARHIYTALNRQMDWPDDCDEVGRGDTRIVVRCRRSNLVYKIGNPANNRVEHDTLSAARAAGEPWAPETTLYEWTALHPPGLPRDCQVEVDAAVIVMPYLPDDGSLPRPYPTPVWDCDVHAHKGRYWVVDAGGLP